MKPFLLLAAAGAVSLCAFSYGAQASTLVMYESFDAAAFNGGVTVGGGDPVGAVTDRIGWAAPNTAFDTIISNDGWTFSGTTYYVTNGAGNGAVYLNETNGVATNLHNLDNAATYTVQFTYWGDNRPESHTGSQANSTYTLYVSLNGAVIPVVGTITDYDREPGTIPGTVVTISGLTTDGLGNFNLAFSQGTCCEASPIIDDVYIFSDTSTVGSVPLPAALPMFGAGLGLLGFLARRRKLKNA